MYSYIIYLALDFTLKIIYKYILMEEPILHCRLCNKNTLIDVINLGSQIITSRFPLLGDNSTPSTTIILVKCEDCGLVQLKHTVKNSELYEYEYGYRSGISNTMKEHLELYNKELQGLAGVKEGDAVLDIGSNDSTFLRFYSSTNRRVGIDPTGKQFLSYYKNDIELVPTYFTKNAIQSSLGLAIKFKCVTSISMFYDLPDPVGFAKDIYDVLEDDGVWSLEQSYILTMLKRNSIDTICHEHLEYYGVKQIKDIMDRANFKIINISLNDCNGGSMRVYVAKKCSKYEESDAVESLIQEETVYGIHTLDCYHDFQARCKSEADKLVKFIDIVNKSGKEVWIYGASTKGNCLLQYAGIDSSKIRYAVERNLSKIGKMTSTGIEIIGEDTMRKNPPAYLLVLPWHFRDEIIVREDAFLSEGGQILFPFPKFEIVSKKKKALITGWNGQIAAFVRRELSSEYTLYGMGSPESNQIVFPKDAIEDAMSISPDIIVHLAGISNSEEAKKNVVKTLETNGLLCARICEYIHTRGLHTRLINASSSELYKGHITRLVKEDDNYYNHIHPYSIGKQMSHTIVQYYRNEHGLPFSNGILFMTESYLRKDNFLISKITKHASSWKKTREVLSLGSLDSWRNINHAEDVASAIQLIISQKNGDDYIICGNEHYRVLDIVKGVYASYEIMVEENGETLCEIGSGLPVISMHSGFRNSVTDIDGECVKLYALGWKPKHTLSSILNDITRPVV